MKVILTCVGASPRAVKEEQTHGEKDRETSWREIQGKNPFRGNARQLVGLDGRKQVGNEVGRAGFHRVLHFFIP